MPLSPQKVYSINKLINYPLSPHSKHVSTRQKLTLYNYLTVQLKLKKMKLKWISLIHLAFTIETMQCVRLIAPENAASKWQRGEVPAPRLRHRFVLSLSVRAPQSQQNKLSSEKKNRPGTAGYYMKMDGSIDFVNTPPNVFAIPRGFVNN